MSAALINILIYYGLRESTERSQCLTELLFASSRWYVAEMLIWTPKSKKMLPTTKLQVSNIVMTPSNMLRVLHHLEDYYHRNVTQVPKNDEDWPGPNLFYRDTFHFKTLQAVTADHHILPDIATGGKTPN